MKKYYQLNERIKAPKLRVIGIDNKAIGVITKEEALKQAQKAKVDLVLVAEDAKPPVAKLIDFQKFRFQEQKKTDSGKKKAKGANVKEIRFTPFIAPKDFETRLKKTREFLALGHKIKLTVKFIGRQITRKEFGQDLLKRAIMDLSDVSSIEQQPKMHGRLLQATLKPKKNVQV